MDASPALSALLLSAQLLGIDSALLPAPQVPRPAAVRAANPKQKEVLRLSLKEIVENQERAYASHPVGRGHVEFSLGLDPEADLWVKLRQDGRAVAHPLARLEAGVDEDFPVEAYRFLYENGNIRALPLAEPRSPQAIVSVPGMLRNLYELSLHALFTPVDYAVLYEDGRLGPASVSLIREDHRGTFWITHKTLKEMQTVQWFLAVDGVMFGMRLAGDSLVFYSAPVPDVPPKAAPSKRAR